MKYAILGRHSDSQIVESYNEINTQNITTLQSL
ncbi:MAG: hypothetical protein ACJA0I_002042 [Gammaproteobacteria bacterium]|jgi:hypothetical protein